MKNPIMGKNAFVKAEQAKIGAKMGDRPGPKPEMMHFDAYMSNNEMTVKACENKLCGGLEDAYPRKK